MTAAYELHKSVNRNSDGVGANNPYYGYLMGLAQWSVAAAQLGRVQRIRRRISAGGPGFGTPEYANDVANESAFKVGVQYTFDFGLAVSGIYEYMKRDLPADLEFQNERQRNGLWFALSRISRRRITSAWVGRMRERRRAIRAGSITTIRPTATTTRTCTRSRGSTISTRLVLVLRCGGHGQHGNAHYDLGAGGRGVTTDCHDGTTQAFIDYSSAGPTTWGGCQIGVSTGLNYKF